MADSSGCDERRKPWPDARLELPDQHRSQRIRRRRALLLRGSARHSVGHEPVTSAVPRWSMRELIWAVVAALCTPASGAAPVAAPGRSDGSRVESAQTREPTEELPVIGGRA